VRVLLVYPTPSRSGGAAMIPKLGLGYLASALRAAGHHVGLLDREQIGVTEEVAARVLAEPWDLAGFQVFNNGLRSFRQDIATLKRHRPGTRTLAGGPLASGLPDWLLARHADLDFVLRGEAEESLVALVRALESGGDLAGIPGLVFREGQGIRQGPPPRAPDLDRLAVPAWDLMPPSAYPMAPVGGLARAFPVAPIIASRGCAFACPYCAARVIHGRGMRFRSPAGVLAEMEELVRKWGAREIQVLDDCFGYDRGQADELMTSYARMSWKVPLSFPNGMRLDQVDEDLMRRMEAAGVHTITFGIDFGSDRMLKRMNRRMTVADIRRNLAMIRRTTGIRLTGNFILGHFQDTVEGMEETIRLARELPLDRAHFSAYVPIPGTPDWNRLGGLEALGTLGLEDMDFYSFGLPHPDIPREVLVGLKRKAYLEFYMQPQRLLRLMLDVRRPQNWVHLWKKFRWYV